MGFNFWNVQDICFVFYLIIRGIILQVMNYKNKCRLRGWGFGYRLNL